MNSSQLVMVRDNVELVNFSELNVSKVNLSECGLIKCPKKV